MVFRAEPGLGNLIIQCIAGSLVRTSIYQPSLLQCNQFYLWVLPSHNLLSQLFKRLFCSFWSDFTSFCCVSKYDVSWCCFLPNLRHSLPLHLLLLLHCPHVLATSSTHGRNNGANCFASVQRKLVLTGARGMIHTEDLRDARVRVGRAGFTLPTSLDEKSNSPTSRNLHPNLFWFQILMAFANNIRIHLQSFEIDLPSAQPLNPREIVNFLFSSNSTSKN